MRELTHTIWEVKECTGLQLANGSQESQCVSQAQGAGNQEANGVSPSPGLVSWRDAQVTAGDRETRVSSTCLFKPQQVEEACLPWLGQSALLSLSTERGLLPETPHRYLRAVFSQTPVPR